MKDGQIVAVGTELVQCVRIAEMIRRHGEQFLERVFTMEEIELCTDHSDSTTLFARRWAAKQAIFKALRCRNRGVRWTDIEVVPQSDGGFHVQLHHMADAIARERNVQTCHLDMGGCRTQAIALVVLTH
ncbi:MAG: holo-ACP synthase [Planctomycetota bacterium]